MRGQNFGTAGGDLILHAYSLTSNQWDVPLGYRQICRQPFFSQLRLGRADDAQYVCGSVTKAIGRLQLNRLTLTRQETTRRPFPRTLNISYLLEGTRHTIQSGHRRVTHTHQ